MCCLNVEEQSYAPRSVSSLEAKNCDGQGSM